MRCSAGTVMMPGPGGDNKVVLDQKHSCSFLHNLGAPQPCLSVGSSQQSAGSRRALSPRQVPLVCLWLLT
jgi:hypothetical protein